MILVTVGNHNQGFDRLVKKMDEIALKIDEKIIIQIGDTKYKPLNADYFTFDSYENMKKLNGEARVVVSHAGVGSIITALEQGTPIIIVPRLKKFNEVLDDHQMEIAEAISGNKNVKVIYDVNDLEKILKLDFIRLKSIQEKPLVDYIKYCISIKI